MSFHSTTCLSAPHATCTHTGSAPKLQRPEKVSSGGRCRGRADICRGRAELHVWEQSYRSVPASHRTPRPQAGSGCVTLALLRIGRAFPPGFLMDWRLRDLSRVRRCWCAIEILCGYCVSCETVSGKNSQRCVVSMHIVEENTSFTPPLQLFS